MTAESRNEPSNLHIESLSNDPHKKESANGSAQWNVNFFHCYN